VPRGLAGDRRRPRPFSRRRPRRRKPRVRRGRTLSMQVTYSKRALSGRRVGYGRRRFTPYYSADAVYGCPTRRRPLSATSIMTPAPRRPLRVYRPRRVLPAVVLSRERCNRPRSIRARERDGVPERRRRWRRRRCRRRDREERDRVIKLPC